MNEEPKTPPPISTQKTEANELTEENLENVAGGGPVVGSSSNIKNNVAPAAVVASNSTINTN